MKTYGYLSTLWMPLIFIIVIIATPSIADVNYKDESIKYLQEYIQIKSVNPPGEVSRSVEFLKKILDNNKIENKIINIGDNKTNLFAILRGNGTKKPIILLHHMDVVPAEEKDWKHPPFEGKIAGSTIYGRGVVDIKDKGIIDLMTMIYFKQKNFPLKRDLIFLAVADEEVGSSGSKWMVKNNKALIKNAEYLFDEGASVIRDDSGNILYYNVSVGEKSLLWLKIIFRGRSGHGSEPDTNSSVNKAIRAANKIINMEHEYHVLPGLERSIEKYLNAITISNFPGFQVNLKTSLKNKKFLKSIASIPEINSMISDTISITGMGGSDETNVIPEEAYLKLDCRLLPSTKKEDFITKLRKVIDDNDAIIEIEDQTSSNFSDANSEFILTLRELASEMSGVDVVPTLLTSTTDSYLYRPIGIKAYGFEPYALTLEEANTPHSANERMNIKGFEYGFKLLKNIIERMNK